MVAAAAAASTASWTALVGCLHLPLPHEDPSMGGGERGKGKEYRAKEGSSFGSDSGFMRTLQIPATGAYSSSISSSSV